MVELVVEESCGVKPADRHNACATDSHHGGVGSRMLEPAARLPTSSGFATALRDIPAFACSVQPNRSLPLRPAPPVPRRKPAAQPLLYAATTRPKLISNNGFVAEDDKSSDESAEKCIDSKAGENDKRSRHEPPGTYSLDASQRRCRDSKSPEDGESEPLAHSPQDPEEQKRAEEEEEEETKEEEEPEGDEVKDPAGGSDSERNGVEEAAGRSSSRGPPASPARLRNSPEEPAAGDYGPGDSQQGKMVPPLRLKKIAHQQQSQQQQAGSSSEPAPADATPAAPELSNSQEAPSPPPRASDESASSKYCVVGTSEEVVTTATAITTTEPAVAATIATSSAPVTTTLPATTTTSSTAAAPMLGISAGPAAPSLPGGPANCLDLGMPSKRQQLDCPTKSIEITIPSVPELGIKETRTDRIDVPQEPKPFIINYILDNSGSQYQPVIPMSMGLPVFVKSPEPGGQLASEKPQAASQPAKQASPESNGKRAEPKDRLVIDLAEESRQQYQMRERFRELRARAFESREEAWSIACALPEGSAQRETQRRAIEEYDKQISHVNHMLRKIEQTPTAAGRVDEPKAARKEPAEEARKPYGGVISCSESGSSSQGYEKPSSEATADPLNLKRRAQTNGYLNLPRDVDVYYERYPKHQLPIASANYTPDTQPASQQAQQQQQQQPTGTAAKSVIVEASTRGASPAKQRTSYTSFCIDELSMPASSGPSRPGVYPLHPAGQGARIPSSSPREALVPGATAGWSHPEQQQHPTTRAPLATTVHDLSADRPQHLVNEAQLSRDERRPLDLAIKSSKRPAEEQPQDFDERKRKKLSEVPGQWTSPAGPPPSFSQQQQQQAYKHRATPALTRDAYAQPAGHQPGHLYAYPQEGGSNLWSPADIVASRISRPEYRTADYRQIALDKQIEYKQQLDYAVDVQRMQYEKAAAANAEAKAREAINVLRPSQRRPSTKAEGPIKPTAQHALPTVADQLEPHAKIPGRVESGHEPRLLAEQFPTLGTWVAAKKRLSDSGSPLRKETPDRAMPNDTRQTYYQSASGNVYKTADVPAPGSNYVSSGTIPTTVRWSTAASTPESSHHLQQQQQQQQQQQRTAYQQVSVAAGSGLQSRGHQAYYPASGSIALTYPTKYAMDMYQKTPMISYGTPVPYSYPPALHGYLSRPASSALDQAGLQRVPALVPLAPGSPSLIDVPMQRYYASSGAAEPPAGSPRAGLHVPYDYRARRPSLVGIEGYAAAEQPYTRLLGQVAAGNLSAIERQPAAQPSQQQPKESPADLNRNVGLGRPFKNGTAYQHAVVQSSRNGTAARTSSRPPSMYLPNQEGSPRPSAQQAQQSSPHQQPSTHQRQPPSPQQQGQKTSPHAVSAVQPVKSAYLAERDCPTPNLGEVSRSPSGVRCSNCGAPGSRFECLGCETATYCNETCQAQHWQVHVAQCPKMMPRLKKVG